METALIYTEYNAWLQPKTGLEPVAMGITSDSETDFAKSELILGLERLWGGVDPSESYTLHVGIDATLHPQGYSLTPSPHGFAILGGSAIGALYGVYRLHLLLAQGAELGDICEASAPSVEYRALNHWDNFDGTVERGYSGRSLFFNNNKFAYDKQRMQDYARLLASVGINSISINNVNVTKESARLITDPLLDEVAELAAIFRPFGVRLLISVHFDSPVIIGGLPTSDPLNEDVIAWWKTAVEGIYAKIPDFLGFVVKADSEFRSGPEALGRTQADGANTMAKAVQPFGGIIFWRCFVYNCSQDWRDTKTDRPMAAYQHFQPLDGLFASNVILQIKFGPLDFQNREPISPLFFGMKNTDMAIEYQITQEYTGHQIDMYGLPVQWQEILSTDIGSGRTLSTMYAREISAVCAVTNTGSDRNWTGHTLAQCNLYAFGRMAWCPSLTAKEVVREWVFATFEADETVLDLISEMILKSKDIYDSYTAPLGIGFMVNPHGHYGPGVEGYEFSKWGTYHRASNKAIGIDRTAKGTGYTAQYPDELREKFENLETCPEELLLFFHRIPYDYKLKSGKTLLQHIYNSRFNGAEGAEWLLKTWESLCEDIPNETFQSVHIRLKRQLDNACEWRDQVNTYFLRKTGIPDEKGRKIHE